MQQPKKRVIGFFFLLICFFSCMKTNDEAERIKKEVREEVKSGSWKIAKHIYIGEDKTSEWAGFNFRFKNSDVLEVVKDSVTYNGWWKVFVVERAYSGIAIDNVSFNMGFNEDHSIDSLSYAWGIISYSSGKLELMDVLSDTNLVDYLTFEKN